MPFKRGGFMGLLPVQPVCMQYSSGYFSPCMEIVPISVHALFLICQFSNKLTVHRLPVCNPLPGNSPEDYAELVRDKIANNLQINKVKFSIEEKTELLNQIFNEKPKEF